MIGRVELHSANNQRFRSGPSDSKKRQRRDRTRVGCSCVIHEGPAGVKGRLG